MHLRSGWFFVLQSFNYGLYALLCFQGVQRQRHLFWAAAAAGDLALDQGQLLRYTHILEAVLRIRQGLVNCRMTTCNYFEFGALANRDHDALGKVPG